MSRIRVRINQKAVDDGVEMLFVGLDGPLGWFYNAFREGKDEDDADCFVSKPEWKGCPMLGCSKNELVEVMHTWADMGDTYTKRVMDHIVSDLDPVTACMCVVAQKEDNR